MITPILQVDRIIFPILASTAICAGTGALFTNYPIFDITSPGFQFVAYALIVSGFYTLLRLSSEQNAHLLLGILFFIYLFITRSHGFIPVFRNFMVMASITSVTYLFQKFLNQHLYSIIFGKFLIWGFIYALIYVGVTGVLVLILGSENAGYYFYNNLRLGFLMGMGLGIGLESTEIIDNLFFKP